MSSRLSEYKRRALEDQRKALLEDYEKASDQLSHELSDVNRTRLKRALADMEREIEEINVQLLEEHTQAESEIINTERRVVEQELTINTSSPIEFLKEYLFTWIFIGQIVFVLSMVTDFAEGLAVGKCFLTRVAAGLSLLGGAVLLVASFHASNRDRYNNWDRALTGFLSVLTVVGWLLVSIKYC